MSAEEYETYWAYVTQLQSEHRRVKQCLGRVEQLWRSWREGTQSVVGIGELIGSLADLREELAHHFAEEQAGGCLEQAVSCGPQYGREAAALSREAPELLKLIDSLIDELRTISKSMRQTEQEYRELIHQVCHYEAVETRIVEQCFGLSGE